MCGQYNVTIFRVICRHCCEYQRKLYSRPSHCSLECGFCGKHVWSHFSGINWEPFVYISFSDCHCHETSTYFGRLGDGSRRRTTQYTPDWSDRGTEDYGGGRIRESPQGHAALLPLTFTDMPGIPYVIPICMCVLGYENTRAPTCGLPIGRVI